MHKILEKLSDAALIVGGLGPILSSIIHACRSYSKRVPICSWLLQFHFFNTSAFIPIIMVETENGLIWKCLVWLNWSVSFLVQIFIFFSCLQPGFSTQALYFSIVLYYIFFSDLAFYFNTSYEKKGNFHLHRTLTTAFNTNSFLCVSKLGNGKYLRTLK